MIATVLAAAGDAGSAHPLWHLGFVLIVPVAIIAGFKHHDRRRAAAMMTADAAARRSVAPDLALVAAASAGAGLVHAQVCPAHFVENPAFGVFFLALCLGQLAWGLAVLRRPSPGLLVAGAAGSALVALLWLYTRTVGLAGGPEAVGVLDSLSTVLEVAVVVLALRLARRQPQPALVVA